MLPETYPVLSLADLEAWSRPGVALAVLGHPIGHSLSPAMHNAALAELARDERAFAEWRYYRFDVHPDELPQALSLLHEKRFLGVNLTVPHKVIAFAHVAEIDPAARPVGAVNTLKWTSQGWHGFNTDGYGLATAIGETLGLQLAGSSILLLGSGGAARSAAVECLRRDCASLWIANRSPGNLQALLDTVAVVANGIPVRGFPPSDVPADFPAGTLVINATSSGLQPDEPPPIELKALARPAAVYEMIYNPPQTPLLRQAEALKIPQANGLSMLIHQGAKSLEIWSGVSASRSAPIMKSAAHAALQQR